MDSFAFFDIILLAAIAGFVLFRLWSVLGQRTGHERTPDEAAGDVAPAPATPVPVPAPRVAVQNAPAAGSPAASGLAEISAADPDFDLASFLTGAVQAHEMIVQAFAANDMAVLRPLLGSDVARAFESVITERTAKGLKGEVVFVSQATPRIVDAGLRGRIAALTARFESELVQSVKNEAGEIVEGSATQVRRVVDVWRFERDVTSGDPNWRLEDTSAEN